MKETAFYLSLLLTGFGMYHSISPDRPSKESSEDANYFILSYVCVGFGSNMFEMEPVFRVDGARFVYTSEEVWILPGQEKIQRDTLCTGSFRTSSIDSISALIAEIKDSVIYKTNTHILSGSAQYITISTGDKKVNFQLHNAADSTAIKIVAILDSYIPNNYQKLELSHFQSD